MPPSQVHKKTWRKKLKMGKIVKQNVVQRKKGFLYYVDGAGNVCEAKMQHGGRRKKKK